ncbi:MAG: hypothetical protein ACXU85_14075, partial [Xanthobacteraceae bacterium]
IAPLSFLARDIRRKKPSLPVHKCPVPQNQGSPNPANEQFPLFCGCPAATLMVQAAGAGLTDPVGPRRSVM